MKPHFEGSYVPLPTPFTQGGAALDLGALRRLVDYHLEHRTAGIVPLGTTGETPTLTSREYAEVLETTVAHTAGRKPVIPGVGTNCTRTTVERARFAERAGADAVLVVTPYYNKPTPRGLFLHYAAVAEAITIPIVLYNVPSRTGVDLKPDVVLELARRFPHVAAVKEASTSIERARELAAIEGITVLCGEDALVSDFARAGARGSIAVTANVLPDELAEWIETSRNGDHQRAAELSLRIVPIAKAMFVETNPAPVKAALALRGLCEPDVRLPLAPLEPASRAKLEAALATSERVAT